jgi:hypothetical protein
MLFITVDNLDPVEAAIAEVPIVNPRHTTFYGSFEFYLWEPEGNTVGFAQMLKG